MSSVSQEILNHLVIRQKNRIEKDGEYIVQSILPRVLAAFDDKRVIVLTGIRRCGKLRLLKQIMQTKTRYCSVSVPSRSAMNSLKKTGIVRPGAFLRQQKISGYRKP